MKNNFIICFITSVLILSCSTSKKGGNSKNTLAGTWQATPITIDGDSKDWPSPYPSYDADAKIAYATSNDTRNLYVTMESGDERTLYKILKQGLTISIDTHGRKDPQFFINYPMQNDNEPIDIDNIHESRSQMAMKQSENRINRMMQHAGQFSLEGFAGCNGGYMVSQTLPCGVKVKARMDEYKQFVWEAAIPFKAIYGIDSISSSIASRPISVCYTVHGFKKATKTSGGDNSSMSNVGGAAGNNNQNRNAANINTQPSSQDPNQYYYQTTKTWKQFGVTYQR
ncbi:MAG: hypothetical protein K0Q79_207 [Flavipsychrobacter sp.]|jgi:hypothetical protein|nr:hypothetical protein [Flavipsychrobacter sp.]